jgi:cardiolipin synthase
LVPSGPDRTDDTIHIMLISGCFTSQRRILAVTPYFVPDAALLAALTLAARRGIEVDLVLPAHSNHRVADFVRHRSLRDLVTAGGRVWLHPRMIHAKAIVIDDELALAGSANLDGRSLFLNYEMMVAFYDRKAVTDFAGWIEARRQEGKPYLVRQPGMLRELAEGLLLWLAFQL